MLVVLWICTIIIFMSAYLINKKRSSGPIGSMQHDICNMYNVYRIESKSMGS